jgi:hypothetical protein
VTLPVSAAVAFHLVAVVAFALAAPSGPWLTRYGPSPALGPQFAESVASVTTNHYLKPLRMTHRYQFITTLPETVGIFFEVRLKDAKGGLLRTLRFPEPSANPWVRHRESLLALGLAGDREVEVQGPTERIPAPNKADLVSYWDDSQKNVWHLKTVPANDLVRVLAERREKAAPQPPTPLNRPSERAVMLANSYCRYLCREYGAASAELVRHSRNPIGPEAMFDPQALALSPTLVSHFGEVRHEE